MWWIPLAQAGISAIGNVLGTSAQNTYNRQALEQQYYYNQNLMSQQFRQNVDLWNMQNAYNTPQAQMERFKAAGLNPNLIYSQQNTAGPVQGVTPQNVTVQPKQSAIGSVASTLADGAAQAFQNLATWQHDQKLRSQQEEMNDIRIQKERYNAAIQQFAAEHQEDYLSLKRLTGDYTKARTNYVQGQEERASSLFPYQKTIQEAAAERAEYEATVGLYVKEEMARVKLEREKAKLLNDLEQPGLTRAKKRKIEADIRNINSQIAARAANINLATMRLADQSEKWHKQLSFQQSKHESQMLYNWSKFAFDQERWEYNKDRQFMNDFDKQMNEVTPLGLVKKVF